MSVKLLTEHHLEFLSLKGGCTGSSESTLVKMPHCWNQISCHGSNIFLNLTYEHVYIDFITFVTFLFAKSLLSLSLCELTAH